MGHTYFKSKKNTYSPQSIFPCKLATLARVIRNNSLIVVPIYNYSNPPRIAFSQSELKLTLLSVK